ncbi:divalent-cation tolerance protein CutA [Archaeoglobus neptunius]|uniref:divalent-cation tolerance protein CutA n=1 Tax=Archaeoglobus neptunius TaxID=2798580 RepID=UPI00192715F3|nr:divalent-cation tolerance protein CutA [Archaeoglobus neptunius]
MHNFIYITASSKEEAEGIARDLLEKRLAACVNIFPIKSYFWWEGKIEGALEWALIVKTRSEKFAEIRDEVKKIHSYSVPCICAIPIERGLKEFLEWIDETVEG